ncbi:MAG TPA: hydrolase Nlp/P60 [Lutibacter sp.]|nr:hydrolase Nlp/P60 [Lutibacter sp.]
MDETYEATYAVSYLSVLPLRAEPSHRSEMVSQILFGEYLKVLETREEWSYIQLEQDTYKGWVETFQITAVTKKEYEQITQSPKVKVLDNLTTITFDNNKLTLVKGSNLPFYSEGTFLYKGERIPYTAAVISGNQNTENLVETAYSYINTPYLWGGKNPLGVDCSGFSQMVYHLNGHMIHRDASLQAKQGELIAFLAEAKPGDLAFFDNDKGNITHVGIILEDEKIIHAAHGKVRIDKLDQEGIYNSEEKKYTHHLRMVRRYF